MAKRKKEKKETWFDFFVVPAGTYPYDIVCYFGTNRDWLINRMKHNITLSESITIRNYDLKKGMVFMLDSNVTLLWMPEKPKTIKDLGVLVHETFHAVDEIYRFIGINLSGDSCEAYAYFIEHLFVQILGNLKIQIK